ncbi:MAG: SIS domain-containing protein [Kiritimatiellia bacterium]
MERQSDFELEKLLERHLSAVALAVRRVSQDSTERLVSFILGAERVFVTGQGRSGLIAGCFATRLTQMGFRVHIPGQPTCRRIQARDLMIAVSCSGVTSTTIEFARISREAGSSTALITSSADSVLADMADETILIPANDPDIRKSCQCVVGPRNNTVFEESALLYLDALVYVLLERTDIPKDMMGQSHTNLE